ncbi:MAG: hypothetical protein NTW31_02820 [Bacteroidetes bacterium]|nr:hypothetical protein [Bacteroidota bacterium]
MKTIGTLVCSVLLSVSMIRGQGFETFRNFPLVSGSYANGSFTGADSSVWTYIQCRGDKAIELPTPCLGKKRNALPKLVSGIIHHGCGRIIFSYRQAFSTAVNLDLLINGTLFRNVISPGGNADTGLIHSSDSINISIAGDFIIEFRQSDSLNSGQVCIDNVYWTPCESGLGSEDKIAGAFACLPMKFLWLGKTISVHSQVEGEKKLAIYSTEGRLVRELVFSGFCTDLFLVNCREGIYIAILRDKEKNIMSRGKLVFY